MLDCLEKIEARLQLLIDSRLFETPGEASRTMRYLKIGIDAKRFPGSEDDDYPFTALRLGPCEDKAGSSVFKVILVMGLYVDADSDGDGDVDVDDTPTAAAIFLMSEMLTLLRSGLASDGNYSPYSYESAKWQLGDENGNHPGPDLYWIAGELLFSQEPIF